MPEPHLAVGSQQPSKTEEKLRLYSMEFCPYAERARLVLRAKNIPYETVNINLINKPEWYFNIHPKGLVPVLHIGSKFIFESLDIVDYLDETYPENPLYPADPAAKKRDQDLIQKIDPITVTFYKCMSKQDNKTLDQWVEEFSLQLDVFETELARRKTTFFGGDKPGMVDYMLWPWCERAGILAIEWGQKLPFGDDKFSNLKKWSKAMRQDPVCAEFYYSSETFWKVVQIKRGILPPDFDNL